MYLLESHKLLMSDPKHQSEKIGDYSKIRKKSLRERLTPVENLVRRYAPLPVTYDIGRLQQPYFSEYTYNDSMDAIYVTPQSSEIAARMAVLALEDEINPRFDFTTSFEKGRNELNQFDKYNLDEANTIFPKKVVFPPGSNMLSKIVSKENLFRLMYEDPQVMIKPHPLTNSEHIRKLGRDFGYHRLLSPNTGSERILENVDVMWGTTASEMPVRAALMGKRVLNISNFFEEQVGSHLPINRLLWNVDGEEAKIRATRVLGSPLGGFFFAEDPNLAENLQLYFAKTMEIRESCKTVTYSMPDHLKLEVWKREGQK